jgi:hypothetical protein
MSTALVAPTVMTAVVGIPLHFATFRLLQVRTKQC